MQTDKDQNVNAVGFKVMFNDVKNEHLRYRVFYHDMMQLDLCICIKTNNGVHLFDQKCNRM